jgi:hypothetical protein
MEAPADICSLAKQALRVLVQRQAVFFTHSESLFDDLRSAHLQRREIPIVYEALLREGSYETRAPSPVSSMSFPGRAREVGSYETGAPCPVSSMFFPGRAREGGSYETGPAALAVSH